MSTTVYWVVPINPIFAEILKEIFIKIMLGEMRPIGSNTLATLLSKTGFVRKGISNSSWRDNISSKLIVSVSLFESHIVPKIFPVVSLSLSTQELSKLVSPVWSSLIKTGSGNNCLFLFNHSHQFRAICTPFSHVHAGL